MAELRPGGTAARVMNVLTTDPDRPWRKAVDLVEELEVVYQVLYGSMTVPVQRGIFSRFTFDGAVCFGLPGKEPEGAVMPDGRRVRGDGSATQPGLGWTPPAVPVAASPEPDQRSADVERRETTAVRTPERRGAGALAPEPRGFACALYSDGRWFIEFEGVQITLPPEYAERMFAYVNRVWQRAQELDSACA